MTAGWQGGLAATIEAPLPLRDGDARPQPPGPGAAGGAPPEAAAAPPAAAQSDADKPLQSEWSILWGNIR